MAITSSAASGIIGSMIAAASRQNVHHSPTTTGWEMTRNTCTRPSGITTMPKPSTIQGIVRQRLGLPIQPMRNSKV